MLNRQLLCCPIHREPLDASAADPSRLVGVGHGEVYPVLDGIPILLPDRAQRQHIVDTDWSAASTVGSSTVDFYNQTRDQDQYCRAELADVRPELESWLSERKASGPTLEIDRKSTRLNPVTEV